MRHLRTLIPVVALLAGAVVGWAMRQPPAREPERATLSPVAISLKQAGIVLRHQGQTQAEVRADRVEVNRDMRQVTFAGNPTVVVFNQGEEPLEIHGRKILFDRQTSDVTVQGPVELVSVRGHRLTAGIARWVQATQQLIFEQGVTMTLDDQKLQAEQLTINLGQQVFEFSGRVDIAFRLGGAEP